MLLCFVIFVSSSRRQKEDAAAFHLDLFQTVGLSFTPPVFENHQQMSEGSCHREKAINPVLFFKPFIDLQCATILHTCCLNMSEYAHFTIAYKETHGLRFAFCHENCLINIVQQFQINSLVDLLRMIWMLLNECLNLFCFEFCLTHNALSDHVAFRALYISPFWKWQRVCHFIH